DAAVALLTPARSGVAAAVNETVVPRDRWAGTVLADGDRVEILTAVQGG
ncbi:sulfur carrier protein ThiS, partial [Streptomyces sp. UH6]